jgi:hypothetical protein
MPTRTVLCPIAATLYFLREALPPIQAHPLWAQVRDSLFQMADTGEIPHALLVQTLDQVEVLKEECAKEVALFRDPGKIPFNCC